MPKIKLCSKNGYSLVTWTTVFAVVLAAILFIRVPLKRAIQAKVMTTADYLLWTKWDPSNPPLQYKGEDNTFIKTKNAQDVTTELVETKTGDDNAQVDSLTNSITTENSLSSSVEDGSQGVLKTFDLNAILP